MLKQEACQWIGYIYLKSWAKLLSTDLYVARAFLLMGEQSLK